MQVSIPQISFLIQLLQVTSFLNAGSEDQVRVGEKANPNQTFTGIQSKRLPLNLWSKFRI